jgi:hypothetical protein
VWEWGAAPTLAGALVSRRRSATLATAKVSWTRFFAAQQTASQGGESLGFGVGTGRLDGAPRGAVDNARHERGDEEEDDECQDVFRIGDREGMNRRDEEVVEEQAGRDGGGDGWVEAADEADNHNRE